MNKVFPKKLKKGDTVAVIAPARSFAIISDEIKYIAKERFEKLELSLMAGTLKINQLV